MKFEYTSSVFKQAGVWFGAIRYKHNGKPKRVTKSFKQARTKQEAVYLLNEWTREVFPDSSSTNDPYFRTYLLNYIENKLQSQAIEKTTYDGYMHMVKYIEGSLGDVQISRIKREHVQAWIHEMTELYSPATIHKAATLYRACLNEALYDGLIQRNPMKRVYLPKVKRPEPNALAKNERERLKQYIAFSGVSPLTCAIVLAMWCGMRESEICALRWSDVDLKTDMITVSRSLGRDKGSYYIKNPKTEDKRTIPVSGATHNILMMLKMEMMEDCTREDLPFSNDLYVIGDIDGTYMRPDDLYRSWRVVTKSLNLRGTTGSLPTFHDLRHTFATATIAGGVDVKTVSSIMGHAKASMTLDIYASPDPDAKRRAGNMLDDLI